MGPGPDDAKKETILNRVVRREDGEVSCEAGPKHVEKIMKGMRLTDSKPNMIPGAREHRSEAGTALEGDQIKTYRSVDAMASYISQDRPDIRYATKELCRRMAAPTKADWSSLKRLCRYLEGRSRSIQKGMEEDP